VVLKVSLLRHGFQIPWLQQLCVMHLAGQFFVRGKPVIRQISVGSRRYIGRQRSTWIDGGLNHGSGLTGRTYGCVKSILPVEQKVSSKTELR